MKRAIVEPDTELRVLAVPADLAAALNRDPGARKFFDALTYTSKKRHVLSIEDAKSSEARRRRIDKSITRLRGGHAR
jgi:uncharacterized protein YdeI (YjbR/CyaY-like superfamily)